MKLTGIDADLWMIVLLLFTTIYFFIFNSFLNLVIKDVTACAVVSILISFVLGFIIIYVLSRPKSVIHQSLQNLEAGALDPLVWGVSSILFVGSLFPFMFTLVYSMEGIGRAVVALLLSIFVGMVIMVGINKITGVAPIKK
jgi:hypothetical protein